jgi:hypothetical protein
LREPQRHRGAEGETAGNDAFTEPARELRGVVCGGFDLRRGDVTDRARPFVGEAVLR